MIHIYECKLCKGFKKSKIKGFDEFKGTRKSVRKHLREVHGINGLQRDYKGKRMESNLTKNTSSTQMQ